MTSEMESAMSEKEKLRESLEKGKEAAEKETEIAAKEDANKPEGDNKAVEEVIFVGLNSTYLDEFVS